MSSSNGKNESPCTGSPAKPTDILHFQRSPMTATILGSPCENHCSSDGAVTPRPRCPRTDRFAEQTPVQSSFKPVGDLSLPFSDPPYHKDSKYDVSALGFEYIAANGIAEHALRSCLPAGSTRSAFKTPGSARYSLNPLSPTFREEYFVEKHEKTAEEDNARDLRIKLHVRVAKFFLRIVSFSCSLILVSLLSTTLTIFHTTRSLPARNGKPPWADGTDPWPQYFLLGLAGASLFTGMIVFWGYWKGGHKRAQRVSKYYSITAFTTFVSSFILFIIATAVYQNAKSKSNNQDLWGWSCAKNEREQDFSDIINYSLVCRLQDWSLLCAIIEIVVEVAVLLIYVVVFYRFYTKRRLQQSVDRRDKARSDLYLTQLRLQSAPNTPGFLRTPRYDLEFMQQPQYVASAVESDGLKDAQPKYASFPSPTRTQAEFQLQAPPTRLPRATPKQAHGGLQLFAPPPEASNGHMDPAPGEPTYGAVSIPSPYASPVASPNFQSENNR